MNAHAGKGDAAACERVMRDMRAAGQEPNVLTWSTLMNAHACKGDAAASERVMRDMRAAGQEPDVTTWNTLMNAFQKARSGADVLRVFQSMLLHGVAFDSFTLSSLFNGLMFGINGDRRAGALKVVELYPSLVSPLNLNHFVSTPILRALADVALPTEVEQFWSFCEQQLRSSRQGWPGPANAKVLSQLCSRSGDRGAWPSVAALLSSAGAAVGELAAAGGGSRALDLSSASGVLDAGRNACAPQVICNNWQAKGYCKYGERCRWKDGHR